MLLGLLLFAEEGVVLAFAQAEHVCEPEFALPIAVGDLRLCFAEVTEQVEVNMLVGTLIFVESAEVGFCQDEVALVWVVFDWPSEHDVACFQLSNRRAFNQGPIVLVLVKQVVPQVVLR